MAIEGLDTTILIETAGFVPQAGMSATPEAEAGPTLEAALAAAGAPPDGDRPVPNTAREAGLIRDDVTLDLWVAEGSRAAPPLLHIGSPFPISGAPPANDPLILNKLTIDDMDRASSTGRYGDSTEDYSWNEMSTGDWDWAVMGVAGSAKNDITQIVHNSATIEEAQQRVHQ